ncbi:GerAB/ArcD/ProY family transporter [Crassaminicella profunda]|uniref:GerAB/ArcD/ProY family transporter n=1 Tax=Crassaminicella profunda TaxID=1286698 RepID=UPI001CA68603|nr:endospore germination permease [Crassaminicella profunda]QZY56229.1 endospore germination permease [Crassaminicella profunda]
MNKEVISDKQGIVLMIMFLIGTSTIVVAGLEAKRDFWLAIVIAIFMALPMIFIYARLHYIFYDKDLFDICKICFGKFIGKGIVILYTWYLFHSVTLVILNFGLFVNTVAFMDTPQIIPIISIAILCIWVVKKGMEVMGRWTELILLVFIGLIFIAILLLIPNMNINNIQPILYNGVKPIAKGAISSFSFPFGETVVFTMFFSTFKKKKSSYKIYTIGLLIGGIILLIVSITDILVLGANTASSTYFPSYNTITRISIGSLLQRLEIIVATIYAFGAFVKISIYLLATCKGFTKIFEYTDYRFIVIPVSLLMINLSYFVHDSIMYNMEWTSEIWPYYAIPFQVILPIIIWITAEIKKSSGIFTNRNT